MKSGILFLAFAAFALCGCSVTTIYANEAEATCAINAKPKRANANHYDGAHALPKLNIPKNLENVQVITPLTIQSDYDEGEGGYWASATLNYYTTNARGNYDLFDVTTNESLNYQLSSNLWRLELNICGSGDFYFLTQGFNSVFHNKTHYYKVPTLVKSGSTTLGEVYPQEAFALTEGQSITLQQLYTSIAPYNVVYPHTSNFYGMSLYTESNPWKTATAVIGSVLSYQIYGQNDSASFPISLTNNTLQTAHVSQTWQVNELNESGSMNVVYDIQLEPSETIYLQNNIYVSIESTQNFYMSREGLEGSNPADPNLSWGTYIIRSFQMQSGDFPNYFLNMGGLDGAGALNATFQLFATAFQAIAGILSIEVMKGITLAMIAAIPLLITLIIVIFKLVKK